MPAGAPRQPLKCGENLVNRQRVVQAVRTKQRYVPDRGVDDTGVHMQARLHAKRPVDGVFCGLCTASSGVPSPWHTPDMTREWSFVSCRIPLEECLRMMFKARFEQARPIRQRGDIHFDHRTSLLEKVKGYRRIRHHGHALAIVHGWRTIPSPNATCIVIPGPPYSLRIITFPCILPE